MKNKLVIAALAATSLFASCQKQAGNGNGEADNTPARFNLSIAFPTSGSTRADDSNASGKDKKVTTIDVFVFNHNGEKAEGSGTLDVSNFTGNTTTNQYTSNAIVETTRGNKHIYVGINLPDALRGVVTNGVNNESTFLDAVTSTDLETTKGIAMLGYVDQDLNSGTNIVTINARRLASKIATTFASATQNWTPAGQKFNVIIDKFTVGNTAKTFYPKQRVGSDGRLVTPEAAAGVGVSKESLVDGAQATTQLDVNTFAAKGDMENLKVKYVPEHIPSTLMLRGESTYAVVRGEFKPEFLSGWDATTAVITTTAFPAQAPADLYVFDFGGETRFVDDATVSSTICQHYGIQKIYHYKKAADGKFYTFYYVYINRDETAQEKKLAVNRNQFVSVEINRVLGIGQPGDPNNPDQPANKPEGPEQPVYTAPANLSVQVDIVAWDIKAMPTDLQ